MKIGFLTACLPQLTLEEIARWASQQGFEALELAAWPIDSSRDYQARHAPAETLTPDEAERIRDIMDQNELKISALAYYDNNLDADHVRRTAYHTHLRKVIDAAAMLGVDLVGTFIGGRPGSAAENLVEARPIFREFLKYAADRGVRLMIENCPMPNWFAFGLPGNLAYSPELWDVLFNEIPDENLGINFDPSHLLYLGIDHERAAREYASRIFHAHAKDAELLDEGRYRFGIFSSQVETRGEPGWWRYRMPGSGMVDWASFIQTLQEIGYDDVLSIEHEDPEYEGSVERVKEGVRIGGEHLRYARRQAGEAATGLAGGPGAATRLPDVNVHEE